MRQCGTQYIIRIVMGFHIGIVGIVVAILTSQTEVFFNSILVSSSSGCGIAPVMKDILLSRKRLKRLRYIFDLYIAIIAYLNLTFLGALSGNQDYTVCTACTVNSRR